MSEGRVVYVVASMWLLLATMACGISFFAPYWLGNVTRPSPGSHGGTSVEQDGIPYIVVSNASAFQPEDYVWRGLWAQCAGECQWFWFHEYKLQYEKFTPLGWHLATQVLYFAGCFLVLFCEIFARVQLCCRQRNSVYRALGFLMLVSFVIQAAAVAVFGGFSHRDYGASAFVSSTYTYLGWAFWMAVAGGGCTLISGALFLVMDWVADLDDDDDVGYYDK